MKKAIASVLVLLMLLTCLAAPSYAGSSGPIKVYLNGYKLSFDVNPCIINDRTFVPMRTVLETAGISVSWDEKTRIAGASKGSTHAWFSVDKNSMTIQKGSVTYSSRFEVPPCIISDKIFVPLTEICNIFGMAVAWDPYTMSAVITAPDVYLPVMISIDDFVPPVTTTVGSAYSIKGKIYSNAFIDRINIKITDVATGIAQINETQFNVGVQSYSLSGIDSRVKFGILSEGTKQMVITVVTQDGTRQKFTYSFNVVRPGGASITGGASLLWPVPSSGMVTTIFWCDNPFCHSNAGRANGHAAIDIAAPENSDVIAAKDGVVVKCGFGDWTNQKTGYGNFILVDHGNGLTTQYAHLNSIYVYEGQTVSAGQVIGGVGSTGNSTGNHLDFYIEQDGRRCDPLEYLQIHPNIVCYQECDKPYFNQIMKKRGLPTQ